MPMYVYRAQDGTLVERFYRIADAPGTIVLDNGQIGVLDIAAMHAGSHPTAAPSNWPMLSDALGVNPVQVREAEEHARSIGIPTSFTADGRAILESPGHRRRYAQALGFMDRSGGFSPRN